MDQHMTALVSGLMAAQALDRAERPHFWKELSKAQSPGVVVVCCSDSRAAPELIVKADAGALFVARSVGGLIPSPPGWVEALWLRAYGRVTRAVGARDLSGAWYGPWASIEFPILDLGVPNLLVLGHSGCGGVALARKPWREGVHTPHANAWVDMLRPALARLEPPRENASEAERQLAAEEATVLWSVRNLLRHPQIGSKVARGETRLYAGHFDIGSRMVRFWNETTSRFAEAGTPPSTIGGRGMVEGPGESVGVETTGVS